MYDDDILNSSDDDLRAKKQAKQERAVPKSASSIDRILGEVLNKDFLNDAYTIPEEADLFGEICKIFASFQSNAADNPQLRALYTIIDRESEGELTELSEIFAIEQYIVGNAMVTGFADGIYCALVNIDNQDRVEATDRLELYMKSLLGYTRHAIDYYVEQYKDTCNLYNYEPDQSILDYQAFAYVTPALHYTFKPPINGTHYRYGDVSHVYRNIQRTFGLMIDGLVERLKKMKSDSVTTS